MRFDHLDARATNPRELEHGHAGREEHEHDREQHCVNGAGGGEPIRLRGLPAIGQNVSSAIPGTDRALLAKESRRRR